MLNFTHIAIPFFGSLLLSLLLGKLYLNRLTFFCQADARVNTLRQHKKKDNTPTMGGIFVLVSIVANIIIWCDLFHTHTLTFLIVLFGFGAVGFFDDWYKICDGKGIFARTKFILQFLIACIASILLVTGIGVSTVVHVPYFTSMTIDIGIFYIPWALFVIVGCSNAVNLTDGLDGLAARILIINFVIFSYIAYSLHSKSSICLPGDTAELVIIGAICAGALLGLLYYNRYPARVFMGDVGSLSLGAGLALYTLLTKHELLLVLSGGIFVIETVSVILQVASLKLRKRRIFKMAPLHHHFELLGYSEPHITRWFTGITLILCTLALVVFWMCGEC